jgi:hypothetical protein
MVRNHLYVVLTDGAQVLLVEAPKGTSAARGLMLPNWSLWPVTSPRPKTHWPERLVQHVTYGLLNGTRESVRLPRQPQLDPDVILVRLHVDPGVLDRVVQQCRRVGAGTRHRGARAIPTLAQHLRAQDVCELAEDVHIT